MASDNETSCVSDPNFAVICSFLEKFAKSCGISHPNILELQEMLENSQEVPQPLVDLHVKLLRKARKSVSGERWEKAIIKFCHSYSNQDGWEIERFGYKKARISVKLRILKMLLELQFDLNTKFKTEVNRLSADELRCQPLGRDKMGQTYWCQLDDDCNLRVYREDLDDETWEVVARDRDGLVQLISQLSSNDPFRKDSEAILNEDSNSLEIEKPITDTGQATDLQEGSAAAESLDNDEEFEEIDDEESEDKEDDIPSYRSIAESSSAEKEEDKKECHFKKKDVDMLEEKTEPQGCMLKTVKTKQNEENEINPPESSDSTLENTEPTQKFPDPKIEFVLKSTESKGENVMEISKLKDHLSPESEKCLLKSEESKTPCVLKLTEEEQQHSFNSVKIKDEMIKTSESKEEVLKSSESKEENIKTTEAEREENVIKTTGTKEEENVIKSTEIKEKENVIKTTEPKDKENMINTTEHKEKKNVIKRTEPKEEENVIKTTEKEMLRPAKSKEENVINATEPKEKELLRPVKSKEDNLINATESEDKEILRPAKSKEENVIKTTEPKEKEMLKTVNSKEENIKSAESKEEVLKPTECKGESSIKSIKFKEDNALKVGESNEKEMIIVDPKDKCLAAPVEYENIGEELKHAKFKGTLKSDKPTDKPVLKRTDNLNLEAAAKIIPEVENNQNRFSSISKEIEKHIPRRSTNNPTQGKILQTELFGMDLSKPSQPRILEHPVSKNIGIDLTSKSYMEERTLQHLVKIENMNESSTSSSSLVAEDLSDASKRTVSNSENFDHNRFAPHPLTATDLSTKRPIDLLQPSKVTIMNSMPAFSSLTVNRLNLSGKRLHESDLMTNEAKKLRLEQTVAANCHKLMPSVVGHPLSLYGSGSFDSEDSAEVGEAIEEPLMLVRGEGSGADCNTGNPGKEGENGKDNCDSSKRDQISAGGGEGKSEKCTVSSDNGNISTSKEDAKEPEICHQETKINLTGISSTSTTSDITGDSTVRREGNSSKDEKLSEKGDEINCEKTLTISVEVQSKESLRCSDLNTKNLEDSKSKESNLQTLCEAKEIPNRREEKEKFPTVSSKILSLNKDSSKEESFLQSPPKHSPKLWSIETICAPDGKSKDNPKTGSGSTKVSGNSLLGVVSDSLYGEKYSAKFQDVESGGRINLSSSSSAKRPSRWDVGGGDKSQKKDQSESNSKSSVLQNDSSLAADTSEQKMDKLCTTNIGPNTEEQNVSHDMLPAVDVSRASKSITESRVQIAGAGSHGRGEGATPEKEAESHECGSQECQSSEHSAEKNGTGDAKANLAKLSSQGFFFGPGCLLKSPIKKTDGLSSSNASDSVKTDLVHSDPPERLTSMSTSLSEQTNRIIGDSVSKLFEMENQGDFSEISPESPKIRACTTSSIKNDSPSKVNTLHSIDTIMSTHKLKESNNFPQPTLSCVPLSAEVSSLELGSHAPEKSGDHENQQEEKEASSGLLVKGMELLSPESSPSGMTGDKLHTLPQKDKEKIKNQLFPKEKTSAKISVTPVVEGVSSSILGEKHTYPALKNECNKNVTILEKNHSQIDKKTEGDTTAELSITCLADENNTHVKTLRSETCGSVENISDSTQCEINEKNLKSKKPSLFTEKLGSTSVEKDGTSETSSADDSNQKMSVKINYSAEKEHNVKGSSAKHEQLNTESKDGENALTCRKKEQNDGALKVSVGNQDQSAVNFEVNKYKQDIDSAQRKEIINKIPSLVKKTEEARTTGCLPNIPSADGIADKICKGNKSKILNEESYSVSSSSQNEGVSSMSKYQVEVKEQELKLISLREKEDLVCPEKDAMKETQSAKTVSDLQLMEHTPSSFVKSLYSVFQKPSDSKRSPSDLKKNINQLVKSEPKLDEKPIISILAAVPSTSEKYDEKGITIQEDRCARDSATTEISLNTGKCMEIDSKNEAKTAQAINLNTLSDCSKPKHENVTSTEKSNSKSSHILQSSEKTTASKSINVLKVDEVKSLSSSVANEHIEERSEKSIPDSRIMEEEEIILSKKPGEGLNSAASGNKYSSVTPVKSHCTKSPALHSEQENDNIASDKSNSSSEKNPPKKDTESIASIVGYKAKTETFTDVSASTSKHSGKFPGKDLLHHKPLDKTIEEICIGHVRKAETETLNLSLEKTVCKSDTILKKKADVKTSKTSGDQADKNIPSTLASQSQQKSIENASQIEVKSVLSLADVHKNKTLSMKESETASKALDVDCNKPENKQLCEYSEITTYPESQNKTLASDNPAKEDHENISQDGIKNKSLNVSNDMIEFLGISAKTPELHDLPKEAVSFHIDDADNGQRKAHKVLSEEEIVSASLKSSEIKPSSTATPQIKAELRDNFEDMAEAKKIVITSEKGSTISDNFTNDSCEKSISTVPKDKGDSKSEKIHHVEEADKFVLTPLIAGNASIGEDPSTKVERNPSTSVEKAKGKSLSFHDKKRDCDLSDEIETKPTFLTPMSNSLVENVSKPFASQAISDNNSNKSCSATKCATIEKIEKKSLLLVKDEIKVPELTTDSNTINLSLHKDDSRVSGSEKETHVPKHKKEERPEDELNSKVGAKNIINESNLPVISASENKKNALQKSVLSLENKEMFRRGIQPDAEQITLTDEGRIDLSSVPEKAILKSTSRSEKKEVQHDNMPLKSLDIGMPDPENLSECNNSNVPEKKTDMKVQKKGRLLNSPQENILKKNIKDTVRITIDPNDISYFPEHKDTSNIAPELVEGCNIIGLNAGSGLQSQKVENEGNEKTTKPSKAVKEITKSSQSAIEKSVCPSFSEGNQKGAGACVKSVAADHLDVPEDKKVPEVSLKKSISDHKDENAQSLIKETANAEDKNLDKDKPGMNIVLSSSDEGTSGKSTQNDNETELHSKSLPSLNIAVTSSMQNNMPVDKLSELQGPSKDSTKNVPSPKTPVTKALTLSCKVKNDSQNKGRRKSLESISMGIMMRKVAAKSSLQEPVNTGDGSILEEITRLPEELTPTNQVKLPMSGASCQESDSAQKSESNKVCMESDNLGTLTSEANMQLSDNKVSTQNRLEVSKITEQGVQIAASNKQLSETERGQLIQPVITLDNKDSLSDMQNKDLVADQVSKKPEEKEAVQPVLMHQKETWAESKVQDICSNIDDITKNSEVNNAPVKQGTVSDSHEKLETEDCKNSENKLENTKNKLDVDKLVSKENNEDDPSNIKETIRISSERVESTDNAVPHETPNIPQLSDGQTLKVNKKQQEISLKDIVDTQGDNTQNLEVLKQDDPAKINTESKLEETSFPKADVSDISVTESKDVQATTQSSEEDVANDDSCYIPDNDSQVDQDSDEIKAASPINQKRGQTDEEIPSKKRSRVEESPLLEEMGGASSSEGDQGGEPDGSSDGGESEAGAVEKQEGSVVQGHRKSGRGRRGRGRGSRGRSRVQRANAGKSASPVPTGVSEDDRKEAELITPVTPAKPKAIRGKRAPKLMGLDLGVDIVLEQSRGEEEGRPGAPPVRQSRRIAQMKIREEAERRKLEEMTLQQLKEEQSRRRADARAEKKELKEGKKRKKKAIESDEDFTAEEVDEEVSSKKKMKKKKRRKKKPALSFNESNPWQSSSGSSTSQEEDEEGEQSEEEEEDDDELIFKSDHEFSPESDLENDGTEVTPMRRARTAQKGLPCEDEEQTDEHACQKCGKSDHPEWILLCDKCDSGWHGSCLRPALMVIPEGDWFCPPCEHTFLLENLHNNLLEFDRNWKRRENEELRRKRLAYVGISLDNVLPNKEGSGGESESEMKKELVAASPTGSEVSGSESGSSDEDSEPVYQLRQRRQTLFSYRFNEYDDLINSAIQDEMEAVKGAGNQGRGKDIATIVKAEAEAEAEAQAQAQAQAQVPVLPQTQAEEVLSTETVTNVPEKREGKIEEKEEPILEEVEKEELPPVVPKHDIKDEDEDEDEFCPFKKFQIRKKHRRLNSLDISSEDDAESDEDFKGTSSEDDEDEYEGSEGESEDSEFTGRRGKGSRKRVSGPVRRSSRARITRFDKEFINDDSEDSEPPKKKSRKFWQDSDSEDSDASWRRSKRSKKQVTTFKTIKTKSKKKKKKRSKRDGDSDLEVYKAKKPKVKYGGLEEDEISPTRRTRGRKINYQELAATDSEEETWGRARKLESEDEYIVNEDDDEEEEDEVLPDIEKESENESGDLTEMKKVNRTKPDKKTKPKRAMKSTPDKFSRKGKRGTKSIKKVLIDSEEDIPPCTGIRMQSENEDPTFGITSHQSVNTQTSETEMQSCPVANVPIGNLSKERKGRTRGQGRKQEEQKKKGKRKKKNENVSLDFTEGLAPGFQKEKGDAGLLGKQLADVQLLPAQSRMGAEISVKGGETLMQRLTAAGRTVPISLGSNPDLLPEADRAMLLQSAKGGAETDPLRSLLAAPPVIPSDGDLKVSEDVPPPAGKRKGRGRGKAAAAKAADVGHYPPLQNFPQPGSGIGNTSSSSVITRMLQSQPVSGTPQSFTAAATAMGHKYFGNSSGEPSLMPMQSAGRGSSSVPPYSGPPKGLSSPYRPPPPTDTNNSALGPGMGHYGTSPSPRGSGIRGPTGFQQTGSMRLRNPPPSSQPHMFHTPHHPMDPSPSGGGPIIISSATAPPPPPAGSPHSTKPGTPSTSQNTPTPPPPPPYSRPGSQLPLVPPTSTTMASMMQFPSQPGDSSQPPVRHPPPPFPPSTSASHLQTSQGTPQSSPPTHQGRSPVPGNFSPYHPPPPANYHYGGYPPPPPMSAADDALPPSAFQGSPYTDHYTSSDMTANLQASDGSNSKSYDEEGGGEFGGLVSYFSSQREDDLDT